MILWDVDSRKPLATLAGHKSDVLSVAFSPDGKRLASASEDQTVILWDVDSRKPLATLEGHKDGVHSVAFSPDGKRLASASGDQTVILWDVDSGKPLATLEGHQDPVYGVAFSPDGERLASASCGRDRDPVGRGQPRAAGHAGGAQGRGRQRRLQPGRQAAGLGELGQDRDPVGRGQRRAAGHAWRGTRARSMASPSARTGGGWPRPASDGTVILWDVASRKLLATLEGHKDVVLGVAFSPDGKRLASASGDMTVILWDVDSRKPLATLKGHKDAVWGVAFSPDGKRLASASWDQTVILWDVGSRRTLATLKGHRAPVPDRRLQPGRQAAGLGERGQDRDPVGRGQPQAAGHAGRAQRLASGTSPSARTGSGWPRRAWTRP